ncbi:hypothetical protein GCM10027569_30970 [Flindersiella endophytica]
MFQARDDREKVVRRALVHLGESELAAFSGTFDDPAGELELCDEDRAGQARVGVGAALLQRQPAVTVGQRHGGPGEMVFGPFGVDERAIWGDDDVVAVDVDLACPFPMLATRRFPSVR